MPTNNVNSSDRHRTDINEMKDPIKALTRWFIYGRLVGRSIARRINVKIHPFVFKL